MGPWNSKIRRARQWARAEAGACTWVNLEPVSLSLSESESKRRLSDQKGRVDTDTITLYRSRPGLSVSLSESGSESNQRPSNQSGKVDADSGNRYRLRSGLQVSPPTRSRCTPCRSELRSSRTRRPRAPPRTEKPDRPRAASGAWRLRGSWPGTHRVSRPRFPGSSRSS